MEKSSFMNTVNRNLPGIFTFSGIVTGIVTAGLAIYEGYKLCKEWEAIGGKEAPTAEKVKVVARRVTPVVVGVAVSSTLEWASWKESTSRIAAAGLAVAALKADKEDLMAFKEKASEMLGNEKAKEITEKVREEKGGSGLDELSMLPEPIKMKHYWFKDEETGYMFRSSLQKFYDGAHEFNEKLEFENESIRSFYDDVADDKVDFSMHDYVVFGPDMGVSTFNPKVRRIPMDDMTSDMFVFTYRYSVDAHPTPRKLNDDDGYNAVYDINKCLGQAIK